MGIVKKQAFRNTAISYGGIVIGFLNISILFPLFFSENEFGLTRILSAVAVIYMQIGALGTRQSVIKFFPFFKSKDRRHHGFISLVLGTSMVGFLLVSVIYLLCKDTWLEHYRESSSLFADHYLIIMPMAALMLLSGILESYLQGLYRTVFSNFLKNILVRFLWMAGIVLYAVRWISFDTFIIVYVYAYAVNALLLLASLMRSGDVSFSFDKRYIRPRLLKYYFSYCLFSVLSGISNLVISRIDMIMIGFLIAGNDGLAQTGIYSLAVYFGSVVFTPAQGIARITFPLISEHWKRHRLEEIGQLYKQTSITQLLLCGLIFILIWSNLHNYYAVVGARWSGGLMAVFWLGLSRVLQVATGCNGQIILASKYFRFDTVASIVLIGISILSNYLLIPLKGIEGAAMATAISIALYNISRLIYVGVKMRMQPFSMMTLLGVAVLIVSGLVGHYLPLISNPYADTMVRSALITVFFIPPVYFLKLSPDLNTSIEKTVKRFGLRH